MLDVGESLVDFGVEGGGEGVGEAVPTTLRGLVSGWRERVGGDGGNLAGYVYSVGEADGLTVVEILLGAVAETFVIEVLEGGHACAYFAAVEMCGVDNESGFLVGCKKAISLPLNVLN